MTQSPPSSNESPPATNQLSSTIAKSPPCHEGAKYVFTDPKTNQKWYAGGTTRGFYTPSDACLVALTEGAIDIPVLGNIGLLPKQEPTVYIKWHDGSASPLKTIEDWMGLLRALRATKQDIATACMGGHGRTGTFLAIMGWLMELPQKEGNKPISYIRDIYCKEAVESLVQFNQIKTMTGVDETNLYVDTQYFGYYSKGQSYFYDGKLFDTNNDPDEDNVKCGWFWGSIPSNNKGDIPSLRKYEGYPSSKGIWKADKAGWYWEWDESEKPTYAPISPEELEMFDEDSEYNYPPKDSSEFLNGYNSDGKNLDHLI